MYVYEYNLPQMLKSLQYCVRRFAAYEEYLSSYSLHNLRPVSASVELTGDIKNELYSDRNMVTSQAWPEPEVRHHTVLRERGYEHTLSRTIGGINM